ncbi:MAG: iron-sulfur cluster assembly protein, partial [Jannaschia helgolandensis]
MSAPSREDVLAVLKTIDAPGGGDIVSAGLVRALSVDGGEARFVMEIAPSQATVMTPVRDAAETALSAMPGMVKATVLLTAHSDKAPPDLKPARATAAPTGPQSVPG